MSTPTQFKELAERVKNYMIENNIRALSSRDVETYLNCSRSTALNIMRALALVEGFEYKNGILMWLGEANE